MAASTALLMFAGLASPAALAFSSFGAGTSETPYRIGNCSQLQEMNDDLTASYVLIRDIDCTGVNFTPIGTSGAFTGTFNGRGYSIDNLSATAADSGLFDNLSGAVTDLTLTSPTISGTDTVGALAANGGYTTISQVQVTNPTIHNTGGNITGGLVGELDDTAITQSSVTGGTVTGGANTGGLVGRDNSGGSISDSYADTIVSGTTFVGGLVGQFKPGATLVNNTYASGQVISGGTDIGGLIGFFNATSGAAITNSFSVADLSGSSGSSRGGLIGNTQGGGTITNSFSDVGRGGVLGLPCMNGSGSCTAIDTDGTNLGYFVGNNAVDPLTSWDFENTWETVDGNFPSLYPLSNWAEGNTPNAGDANGDGLPDKYQPNVISVPDFNNVYTTIEVPSDSDCTVDYPGWANPEATDPGYARQTTTMTAFSLYCNTPGETVPVTLIYDHHYNTTGWVLRYYNPNTQAYSTVPEAVFGTRDVGGVTKTTVTYNVTDGGSFDSDGTTNGIIHDPVAPAVTPGAPNTGLGQPNSASLPVLVLGLLSLVGVAGWLYKELDASS
jgi:hypothetical protein